MVQAATIENWPAFGLDHLPQPQSVPLDPNAFAPVTTREEAEYLLTLDHSGDRHGPEWRAFLVEALVGFLVWQNRPFGDITESDLDWFLGMVSDAPSPSLPALLFALARELNDVPERLMALALRHGHNRCL